MHLPQLHAMQPGGRLACPHAHGTMSRRHFLKAGATALAAGAGLGHARAATAASTGPRPIPHGTAFLGPDTPPLHVQAPGYPIPGFDTNPATNDPSMITDFKGHVGLVYVGGTGIHHDLATGQWSELYWEVDLRFMVARYRGYDGRDHDGTFGFVWLDVYLGQGGQQIHDFSPGIAPDGMFWTIALDPDTVDLNPDDERAIFEVNDLPMPDYHNFVNAVTHGPSEPGTVSLRVKWNKGGKQQDFRYAPNRWSGTFEQTTATCSWTGRTASATFRSGKNNPTIFAEVGYERSGVFFS